MNALRTLALVALFAFVACSDAPSWGEEAQAAQQRYEALVASGDLEGADAELAPVAEGRLSEMQGPLAMTIRKDAYYQRARLVLEAAPERALALSDEGLALDAEGDIVSANLHAVRGQALEALGRGSEAAAAYHEALLINERLLDQVLSPGEEE